MGRTWPECGPGEAGWLRVGASEMIKTAAHKFALAALQTNWPRAGALYLEAAPSHLAGA